MNTKIILATSIMVTTVAIVLPAMPNLVLGQENMKSKTVILQGGNLAAETLGWTPDGFQDIFFITDLNVSPLTSTVLVNTVQSNFVICSVDYVTFNGFEVLCDAAPAEDGELHYTVFNNVDVESSGLPFLGVDTRTVAEAGNRTLPSSNSTMSNSTMSNSTMNN